jgi:hypothetical protein
VKKLILAVTVLALCSLSFAETPSATSANDEQEAKAALPKKGVAGAVPDSPLATDECSFTYTSGANSTFLQYCVTVNGNITQLETPSGHSQITVTTHGEGYGVCDVTGGGVNYSDYGLLGTTANWNPATLVSVTGTSEKEISRKCRSNSRCLGVHANQADR